MSDCYSLRHPRGRRRLHVPHRLRPRLANKLIGGLLLLDRAPLTNALPPCRNIFTVQRFLGSYINLRGEDPD